MQDIVKLIVDIINFVDSNLAKSSVNRKLLNELFRNVDILRNPSASQKQKQLARQNIDKIVYAGGAGIDKPRSRSQKDKDIDYSAIFPSPKQRYQDYSSTPLGYPRDLPKFYGVDPKKFEENWARMSDEERKNMLIEHKKRVEKLLNDNLQNYINQQYSGEAPDHLKDQKELFKPAVGQEDEPTLPHDFHEVFNVEPSNFIEAWHRMTPEQKKFMVDQYNNKKNAIKQKYARNIEDIPDDQPNKINTGTTKSGTLPKNVYDPSINTDLVFESSSKPKRKDPSTFVVKEKYTMPDDLADVLGVDAQKMLTSWSAMNNDQKKVTLDYYNEKKKKLNQEKPKETVSSEKRSSIEFPSDFAEIHNVDPEGFKSAWENMSDDQKLETIRFHNEHKQKIGSSAASKDKQPTVTSVDRKQKEPSAEEIPFHIAESYGMDKDEFANIWSSSSPEQKKSIMQWHASVSGAPAGKKEQQNVNESPSVKTEFSQPKPQPDVIKKPKQIAPKPVKVETPHIKQSVAGSSKPNKF